MMYASRASVGGETGFEEAVGKSAAGDHAGSALYGCGFSRCERNITRALLMRVTGLELSSFVRFACHVRAGAQTRAFEWCCCGWCREGRAYGSKAKRH
eukprot:5501530-Amphidinium_carterae.1